MGFVAALVVTVGAGWGAETQDGGKVFMWDIASDTSTVHLLGTIHFLSEDMYPLDGAIERAFEESGTVVMEMAASQANLMKAAGLALQEGMYRDDRTLDTSLSPEVLAKLDAYLKERGLGVASFNKMKPWLMTVTLAVLELSNLGFKAEQGIDMHFYQKAVERSIPVWDLETPEFQVKMLSEGTDEEHEKALSEALDQLPKTGEVLDKLTGGWKAGAPDAIDQVLVEYRSEDEALRAREERIIYERNEHMTEKIEQLLKRPGTYFVMIGGAHLVGERGIVKVLQDKGYKVTQAEKTGVAETVEAGAAAE
jgi:uncharacterized protein YbaP (TraB family)